MAAGGDYLSVVEVGRWLLVEIANLRRISAYPVPHLAV